MFTKVFCMKNQWDESVIAIHGYKHLKGYHVSIFPSGKITYAVGNSQNVKKSIECDILLNMYINKEITLTA